MLIIHGTYKLFRTLVAYRDGWCNHCRGNTHAEKFSAWYVFHLYWLPMLPLGRHSCLQCGGCKNDPTARIVESMAVLVLGAVAFSIFLLAIMFPLLPTRDAGSIWGGRAVLGVLIAYCVYQIRCRRRGGGQAPPPYAYPNDDCHYCSGKLLAINGMKRCETCRLTRIET